MKKSLNTFQKGAVLVALTLVSNYTFAGAGAIDDAVTQIDEYIEPAGRLIQAVGAVVGIFGGVRIYNKWTNGDQDVNKELIGYGGAMIFLLLVPTIIAAFFGK